MSTERITVSSPFSYFAVSYEGYHVCAPAGDVCPQWKVYGKSELFCADSNVKYSSANIVVAAFLIKKVLLKIVFKIYLGRG